jgi:hypothetical protein
LKGSLGYMHAAQVTTDAHLHVFDNVMLAMLCLQMGNSPLHYAASKGVVGIITR